MQELKEQDLKLIVGGINLSYSLINSFVKLISSALDIGRSLGTAIRRIGTKKICGLN